ncbi:hypothetical protein CDAR_62661 [Caerostris darwini]|uniref:Uncharacterized protein n=1 Tax=Caerostris darwini TaxID=1538125 RepID=A0AAV4UF27_9ARAC|nr:hypothetical protein CDAR_62661 [Caerostris darwini]
MSALLTWVTLSLLLANEFWYIKIECLKEPKHFLLSRFAPYFLCPSSLLSFEEEEGLFQGSGVCTCAVPHPSVHRFGWTTRWGWGGICSGNEVGPLREGEMDCPPIRAADQFYLVYGILDETEWKGGRNKEDCEGGGSGINK